MPIAGHSIIETSTFLLSGENTRRWCNGMFSNNFRSMRPLQRHRSAICDDRGRVQGFLDAICTADDTFLCILDGISQADFSKRFQMYMILDDIEMDEIGTHISHLFGEQAVEWLTALNIPIPEEGMAVQHGDLWIQSRSRLRGFIGFDILSATEDDAELQQLQARLHEQRPTMPHAELEDLRIQTNTPQFPQDFTDKSFIHDYDLQDEVCSFNKGCYVGQEIINRMDIKKLATKKLLRVNLTGTWSIGDELQLDDKSVGSLTSINSTGTIGLALLRKVAWESGTTLKLDSNIAVVN
jgi:folate-binding protein YgfZ